MLCLIQLELIHTAFKSIRKTAEPGENVLYRFFFFFFFYLYKAGLLSDIFNNMFSLTNNVYSYKTRSSGLFYLPYCRTNIRKFSVSKAQNALILLALKFKMQQVLSLSLRN